MPERKDVAKRCAETRPSGGEASQVREEHARDDYRRHAFEDVSRKTYEADLGAQFMSHIGHARVAVPQIEDGLVRKDVRHDLRRQKRSTKISYEKADQSIHIESQLS